MSEDPAQHPAVARPKAALATGNLLASPGNAAPVTGAQPGLNPPNNEIEKIMRTLGNYSSVKAFEMYLNDSRNPIMYAGGYDAWTQSANEIYVDFPLNFANQAERQKNYFSLFALKHEMLHIDQFRGNNSQPPATFQKMLQFEAETYTNTANWLRSPQALVDYQAAGWILDKDLKKNLKALQINADRHASTLVLLYAESLARKLGRFAQTMLHGLLEPFPGANPVPAPSTMPLEHIIIDNMAMANKLPPPLNFNGQKQYYIPKDMYRRHTDPGFDKRMQMLGYP